MNTRKITSSTTQYIGILFFLIAITFLSLMIVVNQAYNPYLFIAIIVAIILLYIYVNAVSIEISGRTVFIKKIYSRGEKFEGRNLIKVNSLLGQLCYIRFDNGKGYFFFASLWDYFKQSNYSEYVSKLIRIGQVND